MLKGKQRKRLARFAMLALLSSVATTAMAANLFSVVPTNYADSEIGTLTGSRVIADVWEPKTMMRELNGDTSVFNIHHDGKSLTFVRQYTYSTTDLAPVYFYDPEQDDWGQSIKRDGYSGVPNAHAAVGIGDYMFSGGYDLGTVAVINMKDNEFKQKHVYDVLPTDIWNPYIEANSSAGKHTEGMVTIGGKLYAIASINPQGGYHPYDDGYIVQYNVNPETGELSYGNSARIGKNSFNVRKYNNNMFVSSTGGMQYGSGANTETSLHFVELKPNQSLESMEVVVPENVHLHEFRDFTVTADGHAYIFRGNYAGGFGGMEGNIWRTTVSNLHVENPEPWENVVTIDEWPGFNWAIHVESQPNRLWISSGQSAHLFADGNPVPQVWQANEFASNSGYFQTNMFGFVFNDTDWVNDEIEITKYGPEGLTQPSTEEVYNVSSPDRRYMPDNSAAFRGAIDFRERMIGKESQYDFTDTEYAAGGVTSDYSTYTFDKDTKVRISHGPVGDLGNNIYGAVYAYHGNDINVEAGDYTLTLNAQNNIGTPAGVVAGNGKNVNINAGKLVINVESFVDGETITNAIWNDPAKDQASNITINAPVEIVLTGGQGGNGIAVTKHNRWNEGFREAAQKSSITVNGDVKMRFDDEATPWGIWMANRNVLSRFNSAGILTNVDNAEINVNGNVDLAVYGNGIASVAPGSKINVKGGAIEVPYGKRYGYYTLASYDGTVNLNTGADGTTPGTEDVQLTGDIFVKKDVEKNPGSGTVNVALTTGESFLKGIVDNGGTANLWLQNGAEWTNEKRNIRYWADHEDVGAGGYSKVTNFVGGADKESRGVIFQQHAENMEIDNYSGNTLVIYERERNEDNELVYTAGDIVIKNAAAGAEITLRTDNAGFDMNPTDDAGKDVLNEALNALANKLYYQAYTTGERNLSGVAEIAEGLTAQSAALRFGEITYKDADGQGQYEYTPGSDPEESEDEPTTPTTPTEYTTAITGKEDVDQFYVDTGVLQDGKYNFTNTETTIEPEKYEIPYGPWPVGGVFKISAAVSGGPDTTTNIYLNDNKMNINAAAEGLATGIAAVGTGKVEIFDAGAITVNAKSLNSYYGDALFVNGGGTILIHNGGANMEDKVLTLRVPEKTGPADGAVVKVLNGVADTQSTIKVDGLVDILADKSKGINEGISVVAGKFSAGGGTIRATNGAWAAIRAYGEFVNQDDYGTVNINVIEDAEGNVTGADSNKTVIEGNLVTTGSMTGKGRINIGLSTEDSSWTGNYTEWQGYGTGSNIDGEVNLFMKNGANWTGYTVGQMNVDMESDSTWTGYNTGDNLTLALKNGATWTNTNTGTGSSKVKNFTGDAGIIDMTTDNAANVEIANYSGNTKVIYKHDESTPTNILGGTFTITSAAANSQITLLTDNAGLNMESNAAADKNLASETLNKLANKLYYTNYVEENGGERNLTGKVEIAEGLTATSASLRLEEMTFKDEDGQGQYLYEEAIDIPDEQNQTEYSDAITGKETLDQLYVNTGVLKEGKYNFTKPETTIEPTLYSFPGGPWTGNASAAISGSEGTFTDIYLNGNKMNVIAKGEGTATGISAIGSGKVEIHDAGAMTISAQSTNGGYGDALFVNGGGTILIHNGGENMEDKVLTLRVPEKTGSADGAVVKMMNGVADGRSTIRIDGLIDVLADKSKGVNEGISVVASKFSAAGGTIRATNGAWAAIRAYGEFVSDNAGIVNINVLENSSGDVITGGLNKTVIEGDLVTTGGMGSKGIISIGLGTNDSKWIGNYTDSTGYGVTPGQDGGIQLFLKFGSDWTGYATGAVKLNMYSGSTWHGYNTGDSNTMNVQDSTWYNTNTTENPSKAYKFVGDEAVIDMTTDNAANVEIANYSGNTKVIYKHDEATPTNILGGNFTITNAAANSQITLLTDNAGLNMESNAAADKNLASETLNKLANKLYYTNYVEENGGERNLSGKVEIAEGLTATSASLRLEEMTFKDEDGQGQYLYEEAIDIPDEQTQTEYGKAILGSEDRDTLYVDTGVLKDGVYHFTKDETNIVIDGTVDTDENQRDKVLFGPWFRDVQAAISGSFPVYNDDGTEIEYDADTVVANSVNIDLHGNKLNIDVKYEGAAGQTGISAVALANRVEGKGVVEINNAGAMNIKTKGNGMTAGLFVDGGGKIYIHNGGDNLEDKVLTIRGNAIGKNNGVGIKSMNGNPQANSGDDLQSEITIDGLVDVLADGTTDAEGYSSNEAISAVASDINIGGGTIRAINGAWAAIRAYGEFTSPNYGIVNVNAVDRVYEKETAQTMGGSNVLVHKVKSFDIGDNKVVIEGDLVTNGGMGTKGQINIGMTGEDSHWLGNYADTRGYGVTTGQLGAVNLKLKDGSHWKGFGNGTMNVTLEGADTYWTGFSINDEMLLTLKDGATWYNAITTSQVDQQENPVGSKLKHLTSDNGFVDMTGEKAFFATSSSLSGGPTAAGSSSIEERPNSVTGDLNIKNFSGNATFIYRHDEATPTNILGGDLTITSAAAGSQITLLTDNAGLNTSSTMAADKNLVSETLNKLANKLYYTNYVEENGGERNLTGKVQIAEGLTATSASLRLEEMTFKDENGQGQYLYEEAIDIPDEQTDTEFTTSITGNKEKDMAYVLAGVRKDDGLYDFTKDTNVGVKADTVADGVVGAINAEETVRVKAKDKLVLDAESDSADDKVAAIHAGADVTVDAKNLKLKAKGGKETYGILGEENTTTNINADTFIEVEGDDATAIYGEENSEINMNGKTVMNTDDAADGIVTEGKVNADEVDLSGKGTMIKADGAAAEVTVKGGNIDAKGEDPAIAADGGTVNVNVGASKRSLIRGDINTDNNGTVNIGLDNNSAWIGAATRNGDINLLNKGTWTNTGDSDLTSISGDRGVISQEKGGNITTDLFSGSQVVLYKHNADNPTEILGGDFIVKQAAPGSKITLRTDNAGLNTSSTASIDDKNLVSETLNKLANKLFYKEYVSGKDNLTGTVEIAEGLTAQGAALKAGPIFYRDGNGQGYYQYDPAQPDPIDPGEDDPTIIYGPEETMMMRGAKSAMASAVLRWRETNDDLARRMGDLRDGAAEEGVWGRIYGGEMDYHEGTANLDSDFTGVQVGADRVKDNGWRTGLAFGYEDGDQDYPLRGSGDTTIISLAAYGTKHNDDGSYLDLVLKGSSVKSEYTVFNDMGYRLDGDYSTWGLSASAEYGKKTELDDGRYWGYFGKLTYGYLASEDYDATSNYAGGKLMHIEQDAIHSFVGRLGMNYGRQTGNANYFLKGAVAHEFAGDMDTIYSAENEPRSKTTHEFKDTWFELGIGGTYGLNEDTYLYGNLERSFGGDIETDWRADIGIRWMF